MKTCSLTDYGRDLRNNNNSNDKKKMQLHVTKPLNIFINIAIHINNYRCKRPAEDDLCVTDKAIK